MEKYKFLTRVKWLIKTIEKQILLISSSINEFHKREDKIPQYLFNSNIKKYETGKTLFYQGQMKIEKMIQEDNYSNVIVDNIRDKYFNKSKKYFEESYLIFHEYRKYSNKEILITEIITYFRVLFIYINEIIELLTLLKA